MLHSLSIRDFVIVDTLELEFDAGFTVFSGETGAGKSILIDALAVVLGGRAEGLMVREGASRADISAQCAVTTEGLRWLQDQSLEDDGGMVLLRRVVDASGRSKAWINGSVVTIAQLREFGETLIDIYGQHAHQALLKRGAQRELLDAHAGLLPMVRELGLRYTRWRALESRRSEAASSQAAERQHLEQLRWQLDELDHLSPGASEWQDMQLEHQRLANAATLIEAVAASIDQIGESDSALLSQLRPLLARLSQLAPLDARLDPVIEVLDSARILLQEGVHVLNQYLDHLELDPQRLKQVEARLEAIHSTARKLRIAPEDLVSERERLAGEMEQLDRQFDEETLAAEEALAHQGYVELAGEVHQRRRTAAEQLAEAVTTGMQSLSMQGGRFAVALEPAPPGANGTDAIEFQVAGHAGAELRALARVASGGELARISLAISVIASTSGATPTVIFDEVDAGIGGAVAEVVGRLLRQLGAQRQVLCVTHLPQVAARAQNHFVVSKVDGEQGTRTVVKKIAAAQRVDELARMLGGIEITATTRKHAREMLSLRD